MWEAGALGLRRYTTFTEEQQSDYAVMDEDYDPNMESVAINSAKQRQRLLAKSIMFTLQHPIFGVGLGMFVVAEDNDAHAGGRRKGSWQGTHNSYRVRSAFRA